MAAGVPVRPPRRWSRESVLAAIRSRHERGLPLIGVWRDDKGLEVAARNHFGTWENAVRAAGLPTKMRWTKEHVIEAIQRRREQGLPLDNMRRRDGVLYRAARKQWGSWSRALQAAGVTVRPHPAVELRSDARRDPRELQAGNSIDMVETRSLVRSFREPTLRQLARCTAGGRSTRVPQNLEQGGRDQGHQAASPRRSAAEHHVLDRRGPLRRGEAILRYVEKRIIRRRLVVQPAVVEPAAGHRHDPHSPQHAGTSMAELRADHALTSSAYLYFGGWGAALRAAGIDYQPPRRWSKQKLLDEIRSRHERGLPLVTSCREISYLVEAACRQFGSWGAALAAAGVPPNQQHWTKEGIIQAIQERYGEHVESPVPSRKLEEAARRHFGSWANALSAAGVMSPQERLRQKVIEILQDRYVKGESLESLREDAELSAAAKRAFRSWQKAVLAAGLKG